VFQSTLQVADGALTQAGALGQLRLRQSARETMLA